MLKFYVKVFRTSLFLNCMVYLFHVWHDDRCWSKILCSTIPNLVYDFKVKVMDLENFCIAIFYNFSFFAKPSMDFIHSLKVKVTDFQYFVFNFYRVSFCKVFD